MQIVVFLSSWSPVLLWAGLIFYLSSIPNLNSGWGLWDFFLRKGAHIFEYAVLTLLLVRALVKTSSLLKKGQVLFLGFSLAFLYAVSDEFHQRFVPGRGSSWGDVLFDSCGVLLSALAVKWEWVDFRKFSYLSLFFCGFLFGCGGDYDLKRAKRLEKKGEYYQAWEKYQEFVARHPQHPGAPEALFRCGWLAQKQRKDCAMAQIFYEDVLERYPQSLPWAKAAVLQKNSCPDYFPLYPGARWVEGDSDTRGRNARIEIVCQALSPSVQILPSEAGKLSRTYYAGEKKFRTTEAVYKKVESELLEYESENDSLFKVIMKWPLQAGARWTTKWGGKNYRYVVVSVDQKIKVGAGEFEGCAQIQSSIEGLPGATNEYYAPGVGRILTTFSAGEEEKRNTELLAYKPVEFLEFEGPSNPDNKESDNKRK